MNAHVSVEQLRQNGDAARLREDFDYYDRRRLDRLGAQAPAHGGCRPATRLPPHEPSNAA